MPSQVAQAPTNKPSLRRKILRHVLWPLTLTWAVGAALALGLAHYFTTQAYDRALLDDAYALSAQVRSDSKLDSVGRASLGLSLTDAEMGAVLFDQSESIYFSVWRADGSLLAGHSALRPLPDVGLRDAPWVGAPSTSLPAPVWRNGSYLGRDVRIVSLVRDFPASHVVMVAQTTASRSDMLRRLLLLSLVPQLLLLAALAWWLRRQVGLDLAPLSALQNAVEQRDTSDLRHVPAALTSRAKTSNIEHLGLAVNSLFDRLQLGINAQREFSGNVAHELRTPLASIRLQAEHVLTTSANEDIKNEMKKLLASTDQASHLIDQLLALALADETKNSVSLKPLDLSEVVHEVVSRHLSRADRLSVDLGAEGLDLPVWVMGHKVLIEAVLDNLIDNAFRYGLPSEARASAKITVAIERLADKVHLCVTDSGKGLTAEEAAVYKRRWTQASETKRVGRGVGLGLAIVSRYAQLLEAPLSLITKPGGAGLCAQLTFKIKA